MVVESLQCAPKRFFQLVRRTGDSLGKGRSLARHRSGLPPLKTGFHHAPLVVLAILAAVLVAKMNFHSRNVSAEVAQRFSDHSLYLGHKFLLNLNAFVAVYLYYHHWFSLFELSLVTADRLQQCQ